MGLSTNTTYKYLNEGRIKAARGHMRGTFIITGRSIEDFLGSKLPEGVVTKTIEDRPVTEKIIPASKDTGEHGTIIEVTPPTLATKVTRILITISLILIIADIIITKNFSPVSQLGRVALIALIILISYQFGGFAKK